MLPGRLELTGSFCLVAPSSQVVGSHEYDRQQALSSRLAQRGSLRAANLKIIKQAHGQQAAASSAAAAAKAQWEFAFRIANEGIKPAQ